MAATTYAAWSPARPLSATIWSMWGIANSRSRVLGLTDSPFCRLTIAAAASVRRSWSGVSRTVIRETLLSERIRDTLVESDNGLTVR